MNETVRKSYDQLVPSDQLIIDAMIASLLSKDRQLRSVLQEVKLILDQKDETIPFTP